MDSDSNGEGKPRTFVTGISPLINNANCNNDKRNLVIRVCPTTGGEFELTVPNTLTVEGLKSIIGSKLKLSMDKINLLYKDRILKTGSLIRHGVMDGCKFTLLPNVEAGLSSQKTDHSIMQVLENLSDKQVNEFLAGKSPLTLAMRLGDHMMFLQLQLSSSPFGSRRVPVESTRYPHHHNHSHHRINHYHHHHHHHSNRINNHVSAPQAVTAPHTETKPNQSHQQQHHNHTIMDTSTSRNNIISDNKLKQQHNMRNLPTINDISKTSISSTSKGGGDANVLPSTTSRQSVNQSSPPMFYKSPPSPTRLLQLSPSSSLDSSIGSPYSISSEDSYMSDCSTPSPPASPTETSIPTMSTTSNYNCHRNNNSGHKRHHHRCHKGSSSSSSERLFNPAEPILDEATKTLQQKIFELRQMSKIASNINEAKPDYMGESSSMKQEGKNKYPGAVINCMHHVGKGVYSGTFSGTLNPALHDGEGKPKKSLSTIVHILNDLLGATPQGRVHHVERRPLDFSSKREKYNFNHHQKPEGDQERLQKENEVMKNKVEQVQMMLQHRRQKRRAKREARASPYGWTQPPLLQEINQSKSHMEVNMETTSELNEAASSDENTNFTAGELKPEAVLV